MLKSGKVKVDQFITHRIGLNDFEKKAVEIIEKGQENVRKIIVKP